LKEENIMAETTIRITNKLRQGLPILLKDGKGQLRSWILPMRGFRDIAASEMSQDIVDKEARGYVVVTTPGKIGV